MPKIFLDWWPVIQQFLVVLLGSGAAIGILQYRRESTARAAAVRYLAIQLAFQLEAYVIKCANEASDNQTATSSDGAAGTFLKRVPTFEALPESTAYQYLPPSLLNAILDLPQRRDIAQEFGMFHWNMLGDEDATHEALEEHTFRMAIMALAAADLLRKTYPIGSRDLTFGKWDIRQYIKEEMEKVAAHEERMRTLHAEAQATAPPPPVEKL